MFFSAGGKMEVEALGASTSLALGQVKWLDKLSIITSFLSLILLIHIFSIFCCYCCWCCCWWLWLMVYQFCFSSQRTNFSCIDLCYCLLPFYFIYFFSDLYYFFVCTNFGVFCSFSRCFRCKAWIAIWYLSCFLR